MKVYHEAIVTYEEMLWMLVWDSVILVRKGRSLGKALDYINSTDEKVKQRSV